MKENKGISYTTLSQRAFKGRQSDEYHEIVEMQHHDRWPYDRHRLSITIDRDSYEFQSSAIVARWDPKDGEWKFVASVPYTLMKTPEYTGSGIKQLGSQRFQTDRNELLRLAVNVIYGVPYGMEEGAPA